MYLTIGRNGAHVTFCADASKCALIVYLIANLIANTPNGRDTGTILKEFRCKLPFFFPITIQIL